MEIHHPVDWHSRIILQAVKRKKKQYNAALRVGVHRRYSTGTVFFIETNNLPIVCVAISFAIARRDGSTTRWHLLTSAHIIPRPHSTEREQYHWACLPWIFILKLAQQWNTQSQVHNKMPMARCRSGSSRCLQSSRKLFRPSYCGRTR